MSDITRYTGVGKSAHYQNVRPICCLCGEIYTRTGHNAWPLMEGRCCDKCNEKVVVERIHRLHTDKRFAAEHQRRARADIEGIDAEKARQMDDFVKGKNERNTI